MSKTRDFWDGEEWEHEVKELDFNDQFVHTSGDIIPCPNCGEVEVCEAAVYDQIEGERCTICNHHEWVD